MNLAHVVAVDAQGEATAIEFLEKLRPGGPWVMTAILPDGPTQTITATNADEVGAFCRANNGKKNIYYSVNPTRTTMTSKAAKTDIASIEFLLADLDPADGESPDAAKVRFMAALEANGPPPTAIVDSGNGIQMLWRLKEPIKLAEPISVEGRKVFPPEMLAVIARVEGRIAAQMTRLGSPAGTQNIDRILRVPGTTNLPNKKKVRAGRVPCPTKLIYFDTATCTLEDFPSPECKNDHPKAGDPTGIQTLPISPRIKNLIRGVGHPDYAYTSRSEAVFAVIVAMVGTNCADDQITMVLMDKSNPISAHVLEQSDPQQYLKRQIAQARKATIDPDVARVNENYALVIVGDKTVVLKNVGDEISFLSVLSFHQWNANQTVYRNEKKLELAKYWMSHPQRRQYEGIVFDPSRREIPQHFNLWRGFSIEPKLGDCSKFLAHLHDNVCRGDEALYNWVVGWMADIVQHPAKKVGTSLALRGPQGVGKTKVGEVLGSLLGPHYALVSDPRFITGRFNGHLVSCILLHCDEAFWAGDHAAEGKLKDLVTGDHHYVEFKGKEATRVRNYVRLLVSGNQNWLVPAGFGERRFATLDVGEEHKEDHAYFAAIDAEMNNGGREALLYHLLNFDLTTVNLRSIPKTTALLDQKLSSLDAEQGWWLDVISRGELPWGCEWIRECASSKLFDTYIKHAQRQGVRRKSIETQLGIFLNKHVPGLRRNLHGQYDIWTEASGIKNIAGPTYAFPSLLDCRAAFESAMRQQFVWDEKVDWTHAPSPDQSITEI